MNRRSFLGRLVAGLAVTAVAPAFDLVGDITPPIPVYEAGDPNFPFQPPSYEDVFRRLAMKAFREFNGQLAVLRRGTPPLLGLEPLLALPVTRDGHQIGDDGLTHQFHIALAPQVYDDVVCTEDLVVEKFIKPAVSKLAERAQTFRAFGQLPLPRLTSATFVRLSGVATSMRAARLDAPLVEHDFSDGRQIIRFDVIGRA
jgi:hypothetical protein